MDHTQLVPGTEVGHDALGHKYHLENQIGSGTFGTVSVARAKGSSHLVAVKTLRQTYSCEPARLREVQFYQAVPPHTNLIALSEMFLDADTNQLHFVTELMDYNLLELVRKRAGRMLRVSTVASIVAQLTRGLAHIHAHGFIHRDLKPENILVSIAYNQIWVKIADFGLARRAEALDESTKWTSYVATRWYRAPEQLLKVPEHSYPLDVWSLGTLIAELCNLSPLFPGKDSTDMVRRQLRVLGTPGPTAPGGSWDMLDADCNADMMLVFSCYFPGDSVLILADELAPFSDIVLRCLQWDPQARASLSHVLAEVKAITWRGRVRKSNHLRMAMPVSD